MSQEEFKAGYQRGFEEGYSKGFSAGYRRGYDNARHSPVDGRKDYVEREARFGYPQCRW